MKPGDLSFPTFIQIKAANQPGPRPGPDSSLAWSQSAYTGFRSWQEQGIDSAYGSIAQSHELQRKKEYIML